MPPRNKNFCNFSQISNKCSKFLELFSSLLYYIDMTSTTIKIFISLLTKEHVTAKMLADKFMVSTKTIYRAIDNLSTAGVPVYTIPGKNGGIFLDPGFDVRSLAKK